MRQASVRGGCRLACLSTLAACAAAGLALAAAGNAPAASDPDLAVDPSGNASFTWMRSDGSNDLIQERRRSAAGGLSEAQYLSAIGREAGSPQVAVAPDGTATFVWLRSNGTNIIVQTRSRDPDDGALSGVQNLSAVGQTAQAPQVAVDPDGNASFVWTRFDGSNFVVQARRRLANGTLEATQGISDPGQSADSPQVAVAPDGAAAFAWFRSNGANFIVQARRRLANGTFDAVQNLSAAGQNAFSVQVAVDPDGNATFVWSRDNGTHDIVQARRQPAIGALEATQDLSAAGQNAGFPRVGIDPDGNASFVWQRGNAAGTHFIVQARRRLANGNLEATKDLSPAVQGAFDADVGVAPDGSADFTWRRFDGVRVVAETRRRLAGGTFGGVQKLTGAGEAAIELSVAVDGSGNATFVWQRFSDAVIRTRRRTSSLGPTVNLSN